MLDFTGERMNANRRTELLAECVCFDLRKAMRVVSRMYDDFLRDADINVTQFSLLRLIRTENAVSVSTLSRYMVMDRTSITRALAPLQRKGLIDSCIGSDRRARIVSLTRKGNKLVANAEPKWNEAQRALMHTIGDQRWTGLRTLLRDTTRLVRVRAETKN
jgi:DNA-binding MarR family transcriptional regulator